MSLGHVSPMRRLAAVGLLASLAIVGTSWDADARPRKNSKPRAIHGPNYRPPYAAIVVDDKSGAVLHEVGADEPRHPASLTKIMTLYLLFEQLEAGKLKLDTALPVSARRHSASHQARPQARPDPQGRGRDTGARHQIGERRRGRRRRGDRRHRGGIRRADDAEGQNAGHEPARSMSMPRGLPAEEQITTARDQAMLGRAIQHRFPATTDISRPRASAIAGARCAITTVCSAT